jgi:hypothetical protein
MNNSENILLVELIRSISIFRI